MKLALILALIISTAPIFAVVRRSTDGTGVLILAGLTKRDFERFNRAKIPCSGQVGDPRYDKDPTPWGAHAPYIATWQRELGKAMKAMRWPRYYVELDAEHPEIWIVRRHRPKNGLDKTAGDGR